MLFHCEYSSFETVPVCSPTKKPHSCSHFCFNSWCYFAKKIVVCAPLLRISSTLSHTLSIGLIFSPFFWTICEFVLKFIVSFWFVFLTLRAKYFMRHKAIWIQKQRALYAPINLSEGKEESQPPTTTSTTTAVTATTTTTTIIAITTVKKKNPLCAMLGMSIYFCFINTHAPLFYLYFNASLPIMNVILQLSLSLDRSPSHFALVYTTHQIFIR